MTDTSSPQRKTERQDRLAEALRANLKRRKAQQKEWRSRDAEPEADAVAKRASPPGGKSDDDASAQEPN